MHSKKEIYDGLLGGEFFLEYLPVVALESRRCLGAEALIRWKKDGRMIPPLQFVPEIEGTALGGLLTYWVFDKVVEDLGEWLHDNRDAYISINAPPEVLGRGGLLYAAHKSALHFVQSNIVVEITERGVPDLQGANAINDRSLYPNVLFALDDVLSREANILSLARLNIDIIKIDKQFTDRILLPEWPTKEDTRLLTLLQHSDHTTIVEGVETDVQFSVLRDAGIEYGQGWFFSRPLSRSDLIHFYENSN